MYHIYVQAQQMPVLHIVLQSTTLAHHDCVTSVKSIDEGKHAYLYDDYDVPIDVSFKLSERPSINTTSIKFYSSDALLLKIK